MKKYVKQLRFVYKTLKKTKQLERSKKIRRGSKLKINQQ